MVYCIRNKEKDDSSNQKGTTMKTEVVCSFIGKLIGYLLVRVAFPAGLFTLAWNNVIADTINMAHYGYWTFFMVCLGIYYLRGYNSAK